MVSWGVTRVSFLRKVPNRGGLGMSVAARVAT
jgi:hypothetical protein